VIQLLVRLARSRRTVLAAAAAIVWLIAVAVGFGKLWAYASTPAPQTTAAAEWPARTTLSRLDGRPTLVMFAHPQCPCSRASVAELAKLVARTPATATIHVVFYRPPSEPHGWERTSLWRAAEAIPTVRVSVDPGGVEATRFGALASGQTYFYDAGGALRFNGGITAARGHEGDNAGRQALETILTHGTPSASQTRVFGCALRHAGAD
jgi:hypothetical protein